VFSALPSTLKNPKVVFGLAVALAIGALYWRLQAKQAKLKAMRGRLQAKVQQNQALKDSLEKDSTYYRNGIVQRLYSRTDFVGRPDTAAPEAVTSGNREVDRSTKLTYQADSASVSGERRAAPGDTLRYTFTAQLGRHDLRADLSVRPQAGRLEYTFGLSSPPTQIRLYRTTRMENEAPVTETHAVVPSGTVTSLKTVRTENKTPKPAPGGPWSYGAAAVATPQSVGVGPALEYERGPLEISLTAGYAPRPLRRAGAPRFTGTIGVGVLF
jgi:hypothetical protein